MTPKLLTSVMTAMLLFLGTAGSANAQTLDRYEIRREFYEQLAPFGEWVTAGRYGLAWAPRRMPPGWMPYTAGRWFYDDAYGWTWASSDPWGDVTYHYGRWAFDPELGWIWVPGDVWAPAWVAWRHGGGYVGWAPLPPFAELAAVAESMFQPEHFVFVHEDHFLDPDVFRYRVPPARSVTIIQETNFIKNVVRYDNREFGRGPRIETVEQFVGHPVPREHAHPREVGHEVWEARAVEQRREEQAQGAEVQNERERAEQRARAETAEREIQAQHREREEHLRDYHQQEEQQLREIHQREIEQKRSAEDAQAITARHEAEQRAMSAQHERERQVMSNWHQRENQPSRVVYQAQPPQAKREEPRKEEPKREEERRAEKRGGDHDRHDDHR